jgi:hypothetical protein
LATVKTPGFEGITATEGQLFRSCSVYLRLAHCLRPKHKKAADFSAAFCMYFVSQ